MGERYLTPQEAAARLGVSDETIRRYIKRDVFRDVIARGMFKKRYFVPEREVERVRIEGGFLGNDIGLPASA